MHGPGIARADFDASVYGAKYISLKAGESLTLIPNDGEDSRWAFGKTAGGSCGWLPRKFWKQEEPARRSCDSCDELKYQIEAMRRHIEELLKLSHESGKEPGTFKILRKDMEGRYYLVEATLPGTNFTQNFKWYFDQAD